MLLNTLICHAADIPAPSGRFTFEGKPYTGTVTLTNTSVTNGSLYLNGHYHYHDQRDGRPFGEPYTALFRPLAFDYQQFTAVVKLRPEDISHGATLLAGGTGHRWLVLSADKDGRVELSLNNFQFRHPVASLTVTNGQWITLALSFDLQRRRVVIYANGAGADEVQLPKEFVLDVMNDVKWKEPDKVLGFTDYAHGGTFRGLVAGLLTFNSTLAPNQVRPLFPKNQLQNKLNRDDTARKRTPNEHGID
jgi:hypothetical protein